MSSNELARAPTSRSPRSAAWPVTRRSTLHVPPATHRICRSRPRICLTGWKERLDGAARCRQEGQRGLRPVSVQTEPATWDRSRWESDWVPARERRRGQSGMICPSEEKVGLPCDEYGRPAFTVDVCSHPAVSSSVARTTRQTGNLTVVSTAAETSSTTERIPAMS